MKPRNFDHLSDYELANVAAVLVFIMLGQRAWDCLRAVLKRPPEPGDDQRK